MFYDFPSTLHDSLEECHEDAIDILANGFCLTTFVEMDNEIQRQVLSAGVDQRRYGLKICNFCAKNEYLLKKSVKILL